MGSPFPGMPVGNNECIFITAGPVWAGTNRKTHNCTVTTIVQKQRYRFCTDSSTRKQSCRRSTYLQWGVYQLHKQAIQYWNDESHDCMAVINLTFLLYSAIAPRLGFISLHWASRRAIWLVITLGSLRASSSSWLSTGSSSGGLSSMECSDNFDI